MMINPNCTFNSLVCAVVIVGLSVIATNACTQQEKIDQLLQSAEQAAEQGDADAQFTLGVMYRQGEGVPQDPTEAVKWYRLAAEQGDAGAQFNLGVMYEQGKGVPQDPTEAVKWYRLAAEQGYAGAQFNLGLVYRLGQGVTQDYVESHKWHNLAASRSTGDLHERASEARESVAQLMTPTQIAEAQRLAGEWAKTHEDN